jgi:pyruvate,orthophosphate dikinase
MGKCCVAGCGEIRVSEKNKCFEVGGVKYTEDSMISLDGSTGGVYGQAIATVEAGESGDFAVLMGWADKFRAMQVRTNADSPKDALQALKYGAEGIGLTRTEHMFFGEDRIFSMRQMIVSKTEKDRRTALAKLLPMQKQDFYGIYKAMAGRPVTIRLLDPPLHEFLPQNESDIKELAAELKISFNELKGNIEALHEFNPMMGHRGCRLAITFPEIAEMQTQAIIEAAIEVNKKYNYNVIPEIMIPLVGEVKEFTFLKSVVDRVARAVMDEKKTVIEYKVGTMIEIPRACVVADEIAKTAEFFSFGTNDLTQMTYGFSRDDAGKFLEDYYAKKIFENDPFAKIDQQGVGEFMKMAVNGGKKTRPDIKIGICGEHGGEQTSVDFCHRIGLSYVSCSPFRVPIARLAAAQANINNPRK